MGSSASVICRYWSSYLTDENKRGDSCEEPPRLITWDVNSLGLSFGTSKRSGSATTALLRLCAEQVDGAECALVFHDVVLQSKEQTFGMFGSQYDAALNVGFGNTGKHTDKVEYHFCA